MSDAIVVIFATLFTLFVIAWVTILPTIGLLYWMGYLK
jgi:hypothetical protein